MSLKSNQFKAIDYFFWGIKAALLSISLASSSTVFASCNIVTAPGSFSDGQGYSTPGLSGSQLQCSGASGVVDISTLPNASSTISAGSGGNGFPAAFVTSSASVQQLIVPQFYQIIGVDGGGNGLNLNPNSTIGTLSNSGYIAGDFAGAASAIGVFSNSLITSLNNTSTGQITGIAGPAIFIANGGTISTINNAGYIGSSTNTVSGIFNAGTISTINNTGTIAGGNAAFGVDNTGTINTFNNAQGGNSSSASTTALTYRGALPTNYNIIVNSPTSYGQLVANNAGASTMTFGVSNTSTLSARNYLAVLTGVSASNLTGAYTNQVIGAYKWSLVNTAGTTWELDVTANSLSTADTQQSLNNTAAALQGVFTLQNTVLANSFSYDCTVFGKNNVCVSAGGRNTQVSATNGLNNTSALLIAAYRPSPNYRIGAYADQNLSVNNASSTVNLGNNTPLIGLFGAWNERSDGMGAEVKVSAAYGQKNATVTRQVVGNSEPGSGSSQLNSQGAQVTAKYGFAVMSEAIVSPYLGIRYTQNNMGGYTEGTSSSVTAPLTYSALNTNATTALAGVGASYKVIPTVTTFASAGVETDTNTSNGTYSATGISGLTPVNFNANPVKTRPTATLGAYYDVAKSQRLGLTGIYRQESYQAVSTTTVMATYTIGL